MCGSSAFAGAASCRIAAPLCLYSCGAPLCTDHHAMSGRGAHAGRAAACNCRCRFWSRTPHSAPWMSCKTLLLTSGRGGTHVFCMLLPKTPSNVRAAQPPVAAAGRAPARKGGKGGGGKASSKKAEPAPLVCQV